MKNGTIGRGRNGQAGNGGGPSPVSCAVYTRKSTDEGLDRDFNSLDAQREAAEAYVKSQVANGWVLLPDRYDDGGFSGGTLERPALQRLLADVRADKIQRIVVYKIDRLSRSLLDFARLAEIFEAAGASIVSVTQQLDTASSMGRLTLNMLLSFAQFEREMVSDRTRDKAHAARRKGKFTGGGLILGYDRHADGGRLVVNEGEAERVREIFGLFLANPSLIGLAQDLNGRGWTLKRWTTKEGREYGGGAFDKHNLRRMLTNPAYVAEVHFDGNVYAAEHEAIVDRETWDAVQAIMADRSWQPQRSGRTSTSLLAGLLRCSACDSAMTPTYSGRNGRRYRYYLCQKAHRQGWASCPSKSVPATEIENFVLDRVKVIGRDPDLIARTVEEARRLRVARKTELGAELQAAQKALDAAHTAARAQIAAAGKGRPRKRTDSAQEADVVALETLLTDLRAELASLRSLRIDPDHLRAALAAFDPVWEHMTSVERQRVIRLLIERIDYHGGEGKVAITFSPAGVRTLATEGAVQAEATL